MDNREQASVIPGKQERIKDWLILGISLTLFLYPFIAGMIGAPPALVFRPTYFALLLLMGILCLPAKIFKPHSIGSYLLNILLIVGVVACIWISMSWMKFTLKFSMTNLELFLSICLLLSALELTRRTPVKSLNYVAIAACLYALFGNYIPGIFGHAGMSVTRLVRSQIFTTDGIFGTPIATGATFIGLFVFFSSFLQASGASDKFMNVTMAIAGRFRGGPAKISVLGSTLIGTVTSSAVTNIVTTGVITIPLMKKVGYKGAFAAAVESTSSLGSQISPPIMGATAFLICEFTGESYFRIMTVAVIPCLIFYFCVFMQVQFASLRLGIGGLPVSELPDLRKSIKEAIIFVIPIVLLIVLLTMRYSTEYCISFTILAFFAICLLNKEALPKILKNFLVGIKQGARSLLSLVASLAIAGVIIGVLTMSGLGDKFSYLIEILSRGNFHLLVILTAIVCMLVGLGMVTIGAYVLVAALTAPIMVEAGIPLLAAHFFIFYYAVMSAITPPVMVAIFAASSIADSKPMTTSGYALRLGIAGFTMPFMFVYNSEMMFLTGFTWIGVFCVLKAIIGLCALSIAFEKHSFFSPINTVNSVFYLVAGLISMASGIYLSLIGFAVIGVLVIFGYYNKVRKTKNNAITS